MLRAPNLVTVLVVLLFSVGCDPGDFTPLSPTPSDSGTPDDPPTVPDPTDPPDAARAFPDDPFAPLNRPPVLASPPPRPLYGGTLEISRDGALAVAADPDRDRVWLIDLALGRVTRTLELSVGAEPFRVAEDEAGRFHVTLRASGELLSFERDEEDFELRPVCAAPRGVAVVGPLVHVACAEGRLVTLRSERGGERVATLALDADLRDVVVDALSDDTLYVSRFRSAEVLVVADGAIAARLRPSPTLSGDNPHMLPGVAYRMRAHPEGGVWLLHQRATSLVANPPGSGGEYGGGGGSRIELDGVVDSVMTRLRVGGDDGAGPPLCHASVAADFAQSPTFTYVVALGATSTSASPLRVIRSSALAARGDAGCVPPEGEVVHERSRMTSVAVHDGEPYLLGHEPPILSLPGGSSVSLPGRTRADDGFDLFHLQRSRSVGLACASCHPEGGDDGHTWLLATFAGRVHRRTQSLRGGISGTEPLHWAGDMDDFEQLTNTTMERMGGSSLHPAYVDALARYVDGIAHLPRPDDQPPALIARGADVFASVGAGCASCHSGTRMSNDQSVDVGTGRRFQVPSLRGLRYRAPYLHDGRAPTLRSVLTDAHTEGHGGVGHLTPEDLDALVSYLESL